MLIWLDLISLPAAENDIESGQYSVQNTRTSKKLQQKVLSYMVVSRIIRCVEQHIKVGQF